MSQDDEPSDLAALAMVHRVSKNCTIMLVDDERMNDSSDANQMRTLVRERARQLAFFADKIGLKYELKTRAMTEGLEDLRSRSVKDIIVLNQPSFPLDRQTQVFRRFEQVLSHLPHTILYAPTHPPSKGRDVVAFTKHLTLKAPKSVEELAGTDGTLETLSLDALARIEEPQSDLRLQIQSRSPAIILIEEVSAEEISVRYSRLAAVLNIPILVITHGPA